MDDQLIANLANQLFGVAGTLVDLGEQLLDLAMVGLQHIGARRGWRGPDLTLLGVLARVGLGALFGLVATAILAFGLGRGRSLLVLVLTAASGGFSLLLAVVGFRHVGFLCLNADSTGVSQYCDCGRQTR